MSLDHEKYSEKIWTRDDGQIDGYVFKGRRAFGKVCEGLKSIMQKGIEKEVEKVKFKALDSKIQGAGLEIIVEVKTNRHRGTALLKVYGPKEDSKKENSVTVTKIKDSDSKYIVILAEQIIKPLMNGYLTGDIEISENTNNLSESGSKMMKKFKCSFCDKICKTAGGLKGHTTKMHLNEDLKETENENILENKRKEEEISEVIDSLVYSVVNTSIEDITMEELVRENSHQKKGKTYAKICNSCEFQVESNKNYISVQKILKHRDLCGQKRKCLQCDEKLQNQQNMKRHMRDVHGLLSCSTSPPLKKKKVQSRNSLSLDLPSKDDAAHFLDSSEDMEIDSCDKEEDILKERSRRMDIKVLAKQQRNDEELESFLKNKQKPEETKRAKRAKTTKSLKQKSTVIRTKNGTKNLVTKDLEGLRHKNKVRNISEYKAPKWIT